MKKQALRLAVGLVWGLALVLVGAVSFDVLTPVQADPGVLYVAPDADCDTGYAPCYGSLQEAVDAAVSGDTILVATGVYTDVQTRQNLKQLVLIDKNLTIRGGYATNFGEPPSPAANPTTLDAQRQGRVIVVTGTVDVALDGLNITGGDSYQGGGANRGGGIWGTNVRVTLSNAGVYGNGFGAHGGGLYLKSSYLSLNDSVITDNGVAGAGGGLNLEASRATLDRNVIRANNASGSGGGLQIQYGSVATLTNNIIADNRVTVGKGSALDIWGGAKVTMLQTTLAGNTGGDGTGIRASDSTVALTNTIMVSHTVAISAPTGTVTTAATLWGSGAWANGTDTAGNVVSTTNVFGNPGFVDPSHGNYHIGAGSAAVDAGVNAGVTVDIDGEDRPGGAGHDIGADELWNRALYVAPNAGCDPAYTPCYGNLQQAVDAAIPGDTILVATGVYTGVQTRQNNLKQLALIDKSLTIRGGFTTNFGEPPSPAANPTTLDAQRQGRVMVVSATVDTRLDVALDGLNITGGDSYQGGGANRGGGIWSTNARVTLNNSRVYGNGFGAHGGGLYLKSSYLSLSDSVITDNGVAGAGGGLNLETSRATLDRSIIRGNSASGSGGGLQIQSGSIVTMTNNIVADNRVTAGGGSAMDIWGGAKVTMLQTTLAGNRGGDGTGVRAADSTVWLTNTIMVSHTLAISAPTGTVTTAATLWGSGVWANGMDTAGNVVSTTNVFGNPGFVDPGNGNYHIGAGSAAVDAGVDAGVTVDIDGDRRPIGTGYELGADEIWYRVFLPAVLRSYS